MTYSREFPGLLGCLLAVATLGRVVGAKDWKLEDSRRAAPPDSKIDAGIDGAAKFFPVFVRMSDQLFGGAGDYEKFCEEHRGKRRSELRRVVVETLKQKNAESRRMIGELVEKLARDGLVRKVEHFWIVNGFACEATGEASRQLAESDDVSFVYLQRGLVRQHAEQPAAGGLPIEQQKWVYEQVLADWKDDSDEPFTTEGVEITMLWPVSRPSHSARPQVSPDYLRPSVGGYGGVRRPAPNDEPFTTEGVEIP